MMLTLQIRPDDVYHLISRLDIQDKIKVFESLKPIVVSKQWDTSLEKIDARLKKYPITEEEIEKEIENARKENTVL